VPFDKSLKDGRRISIRHANVADAANHLKCIEACLRSGEGLVRLFDEWDRTEREHREAIRKALYSPREIIILAINERTIIGGLDFRSSKRSRLAHTGDFGMAIRKEWRGIGVGSILLSTLMDWAESNPDIEKVSLRVLASNAPAIALYKKLGFVEEGRLLREVKYENGLYSDELIMARFVDGSTAAGA